MIPAIAATVEALPTNIATKLVLDNDHTVLRLKDLTPPFSPATIYRAMRSGKLRAHRVGRCTVFYAKDVREWIEGR